MKTLKVSKPRRPAQGGSCAGGGAYYNENDPKAAAWLRELIKRNLIAPGEVDERSIVEVQGHELRRFTQVHLFAGIGGWSYALRLAGWSDTRAAWTGSCPCPPFSAAGKKKRCPACGGKPIPHPRQTGVFACVPCGHEWKADDRHLWPEMHRVINECIDADGRVPVVFGEQVGNEDGCVWLAGVRATLEESGYGVGAVDYPAAGVAAPHIRQRLFWVADATGRGFGIDGGAPGSTGHLDECGEVGGLADTGCDRSGTRCRSRGGLDAGERGEPIIDAEQRSRISRLADAAGVPRAQHVDHAGERSEGGEGHTAERGAASGLAHPQLQRAGIGESGIEGRAGERGNRSSIDGEAGDSRVGESFQSRLEGLTRHGDDGDQPGRVAAAAAGSTAAPGATNFWSACNLIPCRDGKARRVEPGTFPLAHGVPARVVRLRGYGNAIVTEAAARFVGAYLDLMAEVLVRANVVEG